MIEVSKHLYKKLSMFFFVLDTLCHISNVTVLKEVASSLNSFYLAMLPFIDIWNCNEFSLNNLIINVVFIFMFYEHQSMLQ